MQSAEDIGVNNEAQPSLGSYVLRPLVLDVALAENSSANVHITCVDLYGDNLYIGTSHAEIVHFVSLPPALESSQVPGYIFASRLQPSFNAQSSMQPSAGVQQILLLSEVQKACILCNGTLSFYSLPELSPAFGNTTVPNCTWVCCLYLDEEEDS